MSVQRCSTRITSHLPVIRYLNYQNIFCIVWNVNPILLLICSTLQYVFLPGLIWWCYILPSLPKLFCKESAKNNAKLKVRWEFCLLYVEVLTLTFNWWTAIKGLIVCFSSVFFLLCRNLFWVMDGYPIPFLFYNVRSL